MIERFFGPYPDGKNPHHDHYPAWKKSGATFRRYLPEMVAIVAGLLIGLFDEIFRYTAPLPVGVAVTSVVMILIAVAFARTLRRLVWEERRYQNWLADHDCEVERRRVALESSIDGAGRREVEREARN